MLIKVENGNFIQWCILEYQGEMIGDIGPNSSLGKITVDVRYTYEFITGI
jgi:hypothetical protein